MVSRFYGFLCSLPWWKSSTHCLHGCRIRPHSHRTHKQICIQICVQTLWCCLQPVWTLPLTAVCSIICVRVLQGAPLSVWTRLEAKMARRENFPIDAFSFWEQRAWRSKVSSHKHVCDSPWTVGLINLLLFTISGWTRNRQMKSAALCQPDNLTASANWHYRHPLWLLDVLNVLVMARSVAPRGGRGASAVSGYISSLQFVGGLAAPERTAL